MMYEEQLGKLSSPVLFNKETICIPSYHEMYPAVYEFLSLFLLYLCSCRFLYKSVMCLGICFIVWLLFILWPAWCIYLWPGQCSWLTFCVPTCTLLFYFVLRICYCCCCFFFHVWLLLSVTWLVMFFMCWTDHATNHFFGETCSM